MNREGLEKLSKQAQEAALKARSAEEEAKRSIMGLSQI